MIPNPCNETEIDVTPERMGEIIDRAAQEIVKDADVIAALRAAIGRIWRAPVYQDGNRDNGISLEMVGAIRAAARAAGYVGEDRPLMPKLAELEAEIERVNAKGIYPKLGKDMTVEAMTTELRKL